MITKSAKIACGLGIALGVLQVHACCEDPTELLEDGDYVIRRFDVAGEPHTVHPEFDWLVGAEVHVDRGARLMTIRYEREGTTYEVRYTLTP
jgi:hypothetical protein